MIEQRQERWAREERRAREEGVAARGGIGHARTEVRFWRSAEDAVGLVALRSIAGDDMIANLDGCDTLAHALDDGSGLVAQNGREEAWAGQASAAAMWCAGTHAHAMQYT